MTSDTCPHAAAICAHAESRTFTSPTYNDSLVANLNRLRSEGTLCDVTLVAAVLASCSDYFRAMFTSGMRETCAEEIELHAVPALGLSHVLEFMYTASITLSPENIEQVSHVLEFMYTASITLSPENIEQVSHVLEFMYTASITLSPENIEQVSHVLEFMYTASITLSPENIEQVSHVLEFMYTASITLSPDNIEQVSHVLEFMYTASITLSPENIEQVSHVLEFMYTASITLSPENIEQVSHVLEFMYTASITLSPDNIEQVSHVLEFMYTASITLSPDNIEQVSHVLEFMYTASITLSPDNIEQVSHVLEFMYTASITLSPDNIEQVSHVLEFMYTASITLSPDNIEQVSHVLEFMYTASITLSPENIEQVSHVLEFMYTASITLSPDNIEQVSHVLEFMYTASITLSPENIEQVSHVLEFMYTASITLSPDNIEQVSHVLEFMYTASITLSPENIEQVSHVLEFMYTASITLSPDNIEQVSHVLEFMYTASITLSPENIEQVLEAASQLQVSVIDYCCEYFIEKIDKNNCFDILEIAQFYSMEEVEMRAGKFILEKMTYSEEYALLAPETLAKAVTNDDLDMTEMQVFNKIMRWLDLAPSGTEKVKDILQHVRFPMISETDLFKRVLTTDCMEAIPGLSDLLQDAFAYHAKPILQPSMQTEHTRPRQAVETVIALGGRVKVDGPLERCNDVLGLDPYTGTWHTIADMPWPQSTHTITSVAVLENFLYVVGGQNQYGSVGRRSTNAAFRYDPRFDEWLRLATMKEDRACFCLLALGGHLYAIAGQNKNGNLRTVERYSPLTDEWDYVARMPLERSHHAGTVCNGRLYVSGGMHDNDVQGTMYDFEPDENFWQFKLPMKNERFGHGMATVSGKIFSVGGCTCNDQGDIIDVTSMECFDPETNQWNTMATMPQGQSYAALCVQGDSIYVVGGCNRNEKTVTCHTNRYDVTKNSWHKMADFPHHSMGLAGSTLTVTRRMLNKPTY
ncbi:hypothetical protein Bbelb_237230 [Branchiostoma belcheri]|nr:hypothetical protein Bbelb_237230 [Branchiostoma belcheri]